MSLWYDKKAYALLKKCSYNKDMTEWNTYREETNHTPINLRFAYLRDFYLVDTDLRYVDLRGADIRQSKCVGADVEDANISTGFYWKIYFWTLLFLLLIAWGLYSLGIDKKIIETISIIMTVVSLASLINLAGIGLYDVGFFGFFGLFSIGLGLIGVFILIVGIYDFGGVDVGLVVGIIASVMMLKDLLKSSTYTIHRVIVYAKNPEKAIGFDAKYVKDINISLSSLLDKEIAALNARWKKEENDDEKQRLAIKIKETQEEKESALKKEADAETQQVKIQNALNHILKPYGYIKKNISKLRRHNYFFYGVIAVMLVIFVYALSGNYIDIKIGQFQELLGKDSVSFGAIFGVILFYATPIVFGMSIIVYAINQINKNIQIMESMQEQRRSIEVLQSTLLAQTEIANGVSDSEIKALTQSLQKGALERMFGQDKTSQGSDKATSNYREKLLFNNLSKFLTQALKK